MTWLAAFLLTNAGMVTLLAGPVWLLGRWRHMPRPLLHALWVLLLIKLVTPPLWPVPVALDDYWSAATVPPAVSPAPALLPAAEAEQSPRVIATVEDESAPEPSPVPVTIPDCAFAPSDLATAANFDAEQLPIRPPWAEVLVLLWLSGVIATLVPPLLSWARLRAILATAPGPDAALAQAVVEAASEAGLPRLPRVRLLPGPLSPCVLGCGPWSWLLLPADLCRRLRPDETRCLLLHEFAHLRRGDSWVRHLELLARALYWWLPILGVIIRQLRQAEEECCDAWVLHARPADRQTYATVMVQIVEFLTDAARPVPTLGSGMGDIAHLKRRLSMLRSAPSAPRLGLISRSLMLTLGGLLLPWGLSLAQEPTAPEPPESPVPPKQPARPPASHGPMSPGAVPPGIPGGAPFRPGLERLREEQIFQAEMDVRRAEVQLRIRRAKVGSMKAQVAAAAKMMERDRELGPRVSDQERMINEFKFKQAQADLEVALAEMEDGEIQVEIARRRLKLAMETPMIPTAPMGGVGGPGGPGAPFGGGAGGPLGGRGRGAMAPVPPSPPTPPAGGTPGPAGPGGAGGPERRGDREPRVDRERRAQEVEAQIHRLSRELEELKRELKRLRDRENPIEE